MADNESEKTEIESQKKLEQSQDKGELPRSQELVTLTMFATVLIFFAMTRTAWFEALGNVMRDFLDFDRHLQLNKDNFVAFFFVPAIRTAAIVGPLFMAILIFSPLMSLLQTRFNLAKDKLEPNWDRLNPLNGIKRLVGVQQWVEGLKSSLKIGIFSLLAWGAIVKALPEIQKSAEGDLTSQLNVLFELAMAIGIRVAVLMAILSIGDYAFQWFRFKKSLRLSHQELKDEMKEREGDPMVKQRQRSIAMQRARQRMMSEVAKADVVVTNPTHYAVALRYDKEKASAPYVCAKGTELTALRIREIAKKNGVTVIENKPLARGLYRTCRVGQVIPNEFYKAVAELLAFVFFLRQKKKAGGQMIAVQPRSTGAAAL